MKTQYSMVQSEEEVRRIERGKPDTLEVLLRKMKVNEILMEVILFLLILLFLIRFVL